MKAPSKHPLPDDAIAAIAAAWIAEREEGLDAGQTAELERWCAEDPRHAAALARLEATTRVLGRIPVHYADARRRASLEAGTWNGRARRRRFGAASWMGLAAAIVVLVAVAAQKWPRLEAFERTYATTVGSYTRATLPDGSVIELNGDTEVKVRFGRGARDLTLARGEAFFSVAKDPARPFVVAAGAVTVRAVGTAFNVRHGTESAVEVVVTEGRVQLGRAAGSLLASNLPELVAGQRVTVNAGATLVAERVESLPLNALRAAVAWHEPRLVFDETPLAEVAAQFNARNRLQLICGDRELATRPVSGAFRADNVESFVHLLVRAGDVVAEYPDAGRIVLQRAR
jgi:transmembrane sensor